jgi:hypothetical protein
MSKADAHSPLTAFVGLLIIVGFCGALLSGMAWAFCEGLGLPPAWPRAATFTFLVPLVFGWAAAQIVVS